MHRLNLTIPIIYIKMHETYSKFEFLFIVIMSQYRKYCESMMSEDCDSYKFYKSNKNDN